MTSLTARLGTLERQQGTADQRRAQIEEDAAVVMSRLITLASNFGNDDRRVSVADQASWSPAQRVAWAMRFAPSRAMGMVQEHLA